MKLRKFAETQAGGTCLLSSIVSVLLLVTACGSDTPSEPQSEPDPAPASPSMGEPEPVPAPATGEPATPNNPEPAAEPEPAAPAPGGSPEPATNPEPPEPVAPNPAPAAPEPGAPEPAEPMTPAPAPEPVPAPAPSPTGVCRAPTVNMNPGNTCIGAAPPALQLTEIAQLPDLPTDLAQPPGETDRLFVTTRRGNIYIIKNGELLEEPFFEPPQTIVANREQGLLGIAFPENYADTGKAWIHYSGGSGRTVLVSIQQDPNNPDKATGGAEADALFTIDQFASNHNGGQIQFGADGCLYVGLGDGGSSNDPRGFGQDQDIALGAILRLDLNNYPAAAPGNPFEGETAIGDNGRGAAPHIWAWGLRNPWRFSFDSENGDMYIGDVGQGVWEEIDVEPAGVGGVNYGWKEMEGAHCRGQAGDGGNCDRDFRYPAVEYQHTRRVGSTNNDPVASVTGGYVYRGGIPGMAGRYIYAEYLHGWIRSFVYSGEQDGRPQVCDEVELFENEGNITSLGQDNAGEVYVLNQNGGVRRIDAQ